MFRYIGQVSYARGLALQEEAFAAGGGVVFGLTHDPVMTLGRRASLSNLLVSQAELADLGIALAHTDRGGDITYHGPQQVLLYPVVRISSVRTFVCALERAMVAYLKDLGVDAHIIDGKPGVFVKDEKVGFVGLRVRDGISTHGLSLNLGGSLAPFALTHPCGYKDQKITSIEKLTGKRPSHEDAARALYQKLPAMDAPVPNGTTATGTCLPSNTNNTTPVANAAAPNPNPT